MAEPDTDQIPPEDADAEGDLDDAAPAIDEDTRERRREALAQVRQFGDPVLKSRASEVTGFTPELAAEAERMIALMSNAMGIGLAATQLGMMRRMLVFQAGPDSEPRAVVNPKVEWTSADEAAAEEGCLSLPSVIVEVDRPLFARVAAQDLSGERILLEASGLEARVLQHEIDHLDGVLILDRTVREQRRAALRALRSGEPFEPSMLDPEPEPDGGVAEDETGDPAPGADGDARSTPA